MENLRSALQSRPSKNQLCNSSAQLRLPSLGERASQVTQQDLVWSIIWSLRIRGQVGWWHSLPGLLESLAHFKSCASASSLGTLRLQPT